MHPQISDACEVKVILALRHQHKSLRISLHHAVLDPVVDHLHIMSGGMPADVSPALLRREGLKHGSQSIDLVPLDPVLIPSQPSDHIETHFAQADKPDLHGEPFLK